MNEIVFEDRTIHEETFIDRMKALQPEQYEEGIKYFPESVVIARAVPIMPDDVLVNELIRRLYDRSELLYAIYSPDMQKRVKDALILPQDEAHP